MNESYQGFALVQCNNDFVVLDKAPGVGMHDEDGTPGLVSLARQQLSLELYPVHRLDKVTSGLVLMARHAEANSLLSQLFAKREMSKTYMAVAAGKPRKKQGWVKGDMIRSRRGSWMLTREMTNPAITWFDSQSIGDGLRVYLIRPHTGKTHQIRVALKSLGTPILGDSLYGAAAADRVYLHAAELAFSFAGTNHHFSLMPTSGVSFLLPATPKAWQQLLPG
ncbi:TIGR01621 family pseudouridine synthase [Pseudaeromonas sharmana]|uniref:TIGR01621 family pseudouridine synthase n=1 Tax=Pseudaeromonas sharmana TaxID=328412 RepID=A0ABV8CNI1_9GAMM